MLKRFRKKFICRARREFLRLSDNGENNIYIGASLQSAIMLQFTEAAAVTALVRQLKTKSGRGACTIPTKITLGEAEALASPIVI